MANPQTIGKTMSFKMGAGGITTGSWHLLTNGVTNRLNMTIANNGVENDLSTSGTLYVIAQATGGSAPTAAVTDAGVIPLNVGDSITSNYGNDIDIAIQCATSSICGYVEELTVVGNAVKHSR